MSGDTMMEEVEVAAAQPDTNGSGGPAPQAPVPGLGNVTATFVIVGPRAGNVRFRITNLHFTTDRPAAVLVQPRQGDNQDFGFPDLFDVQVLTTARDNILCLVSRRDAPNGGWGQNLRLDILAVDNVVNP